MKIKGIIIIVAIVLMISGLSKAQNANSDLIMHETGINRNNKVVESSISFISESYSPGTTVDLVFYYTYSSPDGEWDDGVSLDFPEGVFVNDATECTETGYQQLPYNGETGDGALVTWGNIDGGSGMGGLKSSGQFSVNVTISESFEGTMIVEWYIAGDGYGDLPNSNTGEIELQPAPGQDLGIVNLVPAFVLTGTDFVPVVHVKNEGIQDVASFSVNVKVPEFDYDQTLTVNNTIAFGEVVLVELPAHTALVDGPYVATASIVEGGGENQQNDQFVINGLVSPYAEAYAINGVNLTYNEVKLAIGEMVNTGEVESTPWPMAEEFDGNHIYRVNSDASIGTVSHDGSFYHLGYMTGVEGYTAALAYNWDTGVMYVVVQNIETNYSHICTLDMQTYELTEIGVSTQLITGMDFASDGYLYAVTIQDQLLKIDPVSGESTEVGPIGIDIAYPQDVSYDENTGLLYTLASGLNFSYFGTYDLTTGAFQLIKDMQGVYFYTLVITNIPKEYTPVTFSVDMSSAPGFSAPNDQVYISGSFNDWAEPGSDDNYLLIPADDGLSYSLTLEVEPGTYQYKYYINPGWDNAEWGDQAPHRAFEASEEAVLLNDTWGVHPENYFPVTFHVDMSSALDFSSSNDSVFLSGSMNDWDVPGGDEDFLLSASDNDMIYSATVYLQPGEYDYKYYINPGWDGAEWSDEIPSRSFELVDTAMVMIDTWGDYGTLVNDLQNHFAVFPNPANDILVVTDTEAMQRIEVYNIAGHKVVDEKVNGNEHKINVAELPQGVYILRVITAKGTVSAARILISR